MKKFFKFKKLLRIWITHRVKLEQLWKTYFYKFLTIWKSPPQISTLKNLPISDTLALFFLEKNKLKFFYPTFRLLFFNRPAKMIHKKTIFLKKLKFFSYFNKFYFPKIPRKRFMKKLFWFRQKKFLWSKVNKINYQIMKILIYNKWKKINKREIYYLARNAYFSKINLRHTNLYFFKKKLLARFARKLFFWCQKLNNFIVKAGHFQKSWGFKLSKIISKKLRKIFFNKLLTIKLTKFKEKLFSMQFKTSSFYKIFSTEFYVPFQILFFRKSILRFTNTTHFILPVKKLAILNFDPIVNFYYAKFKIYNLKLINLKNLSLASQNYIDQGFNFFNANWLEKILLPILLFFSQFKKNYILPEIYLFIDTFLVKQKFLPFFARKFLKNFLLQTFDLNYDSIDCAEDIENNNLVTLLFYHFLGEIFELIFSFSSTKLLFVNSQNWKNIFFNQLTPLNFWTKNWEYNKFYSVRYVYKWRAKTNFYINWANKNQHLSFYFDFNFFFKPKHLWKYWKSMKLNWKKSFFDITWYISKTYFPSNFIWTQTYWRFFYARVVTKWKWFKTWVTYGKTKVIYDSFMILQNKFWPLLQETKSLYEHLCSYGFAFWTGSLDFNLDWNFLIGYKGTLAFKLKKKKIIKISKKKLLNEKINSGFFNTTRVNPLFYTFFSFLNRAYLLQYLVQFGHTKANYNTSYKDYLVMIYNEWFILNILNIQLNLKWNFKILFKMFFYGGFVCLVGTFNILLEGLVGIYGNYANQPYTRYIWVNGLFSNFDKIFQATQTKIADLYSARIYLTRWMVKELMNLWFSMRGVIQNLNIDISFFPSLYKSSWVFLETSAKFYPTMTTSNTECFLPTVFLDYTAVSNDYSLLTLSLYINLLIVIFKKTKLTRQLEFSVYPQKLIVLAFKNKKLPYYLDLKFYKLFWQTRVVLSFIRWAKFIYFEKSKLELANIFKYLFIFWRQSLLTIWKQKFWKLFHFTPKRTFNSIFF